MKHVLIASALAASLGLALSGPAAIAAPAPAAAKTLPALASEAGKVEQVDGRWHRRHHRRWWFFVRPDRR